MRLLEYRCRNEVRLGVIRGESVFDVAELDHALPGRMLLFIEAGNEALSLLQTALPKALESQSMGNHETLPPAVPLPNPPKLLCVAANYREHIVESGFAAPQEQGVLTPQFFSKFPSTALIGHQASIPLGPRSLATDWELELAVVIGEGGKSIPADKALSHVFGYCVLNDVSERKLNSDVANREKRPNDNFFDWLTGKWLDGFAPMGPYITTADEVPDPQNLAMRLEVNGEVMQDSTTAKMITPVSELIAYISRIVRLEPGDIIATGTPEGTGMSRGRFLVPGDRVRCSIDGLGVLENTVEDGTGDMQV